MTYLGRESQGAGRKEADTHPCWCLGETLVVFQASVVGFGKEGQMPRRRLVQVFVLGKGCNEKVDENVEACEVEEKTILLPGCLGGYIGLWTCSSTAHLRPETAPKRVVGSLWESQLGKNQRLGPILAYKEALGIHVHL